MASVCEERDRIASQVVNAIYKVHKSLGPGLLESVYEACLEHELRKAGLNVERQVKVPIHYDGLDFNEGFRLDLLIENSIVCELKAGEKHCPVWEAQLLSYMRLTRKRLGFLVNFNVPLIKSGIKRMVL